MGCDMHIHIEIQIDGEWHHYGYPNVSRKYSLFAKMAGVRNYDSIVPICNPKGVPDDMTKITRLNYEAWDTDAHTASWFNIYEIMQLEEWLEKQDWGGILSSSLEHTILHTYLFGGRFTSIVKYPEDIRIKGLEDVRFIFWFDN